MSIDSDMDRLQNGFGNMDMKRMFSEDSLDIFAFTVGFFFLIKANICLMLLSFLAGLLFVEGMNERERKVVGKLCQGSAGDPYLTRYGLRLVMLRVLAGLLATGGPKRESVPRVIRKSLLNQV